MIVMFSFMIMFVALMVVMFMFVYFIMLFFLIMMMLCSCYWISLFIFVNKVEVISMTNDIPFWCFTHYIFLIKDVSIMVMIVVFSLFFMIMVFITVFMLCSSCYRISLFIFINKMEMVAVSYDIACFCFTNNIFFIKDITIFYFFMMFMCYWICSQCCSNRLLRIIFINKMEVIPVTNDIPHFIFFYNIIWIKDITIISWTHCCSRILLFINSICWWSSVYKMIMIPMFF